jgi:transposase
MRVSLWPPSGRTRSCEAVDAGRIVGALVGPLIPQKTPSPKGCRPRVPDRNRLVGILFVLKTGTPSGEIPIEMGCGSGMTCWRRLHDRHEAGVWQKMW